jgi:hypothetical protein
MRPDASPALLEHGFLVIGTLAAATAEGRDEIFHNGAIQVQRVAHVFAGVVCT